MRNLLLKKDKYDVEFANSVYDQMRKLKYGIASCTKSGKFWLSEIRKEIADYQSRDDGEALTQVSINHMGWLPVYYPSYDDSCDYRPPWCEAGKYQIQRCSSGPSAIGMSYSGYDTSTNLIEVNAGGCITRININPAIYVNNYSGSPSFVHTQTFADTVWTINHNLGYVPNVWTVDTLGNNISGTTHVIDNNNITITFSTAIAGTAYLS